MVIFYFLFFFMVFKMCRMVVCKRVVCFFREVYLEGLSRGEEVFVIFFLGNSFIVSKRYLGLVKVVVLGIVK